MERNAVATFFFSSSSSSVVQFSDIDLFACQRDSISKQAVKCHTGVRCRILQCLWWFDVAKKKEKLHDIFLSLFARRPNSFQVQYLQLAVRDRFVALSLMIQQNTRARSHMHTHTCRNAWCVCVWRCVFDCIQYFLLKQYLPCTWTYSWLACNAEIESETTSLCV